jgi:hypothetical protein
MAILEAWHADPSTWDVATLGPRPDDLKNQVPGMVAMMFRRRLDAREKAAEEAAAAPPKAVAPADDVELLKQLLDATHGNVVDRPDIRDIGPIVAVLKTIPIEHVLYTIRGKHDPRVYPKNPRLRSWRDQALLRAIAERFCRTVLVPAMVEKRSNTAPGQPVQTPAAPAAVFCTAARALLAEGVDPATRLIMRHEGSDHDAPRSTVGEAAGLTVVDDTGGKPIFRKWKPCDRGEETIPVASPMRKTDPAAVESAIGPGKGVNETLERSDAARRGGNPGDVAVRQC